MITEQEIEEYAVELTADIDPENFTPATIEDVLSRLCDLLDDDLTVAEFESVWRRAKEINSNLGIVDAVFALRKKRRLS